MANYSPGGKSELSSVVESVQRIAQTRSVYHW